MEIMLMLIEQCPQPQFVRNVGAPSRFLQVWFRVRFVRPALRPAYGGWEFDVSQEMIDQARTAGEAEREQIYQDATKPDFSVI